MKSRAFTLLELLIVIAIIGVLSSIVLTSVGTARSRGNISSIQNQMHNIQNEVNLLTSSNTPLGYNGANCPTTPLSDGSVLANQKIIDMVAAAKSKGNGNAWCVFNDQYVWATTPGNWAINIEYAGSGAKTWCIDSSGASKEEPSNVGSQTWSYGNSINGFTGLCR